MKISRSVVDAVRSLNPPGRFLEKDPASGKWFDIGDRKAIEKTSQALRDGAASLRKELNHELSDPEFLSVVFDGDDDNDDTTNRTPSPIVTVKNGSLSSSSPSSLSSSQRKKKIPVKTHRRVKSSPSVGKGISMPTSASFSSSVGLGKSRYMAETPMSPTEPSYSLLVSGKPPPSPSTTQPRVSPPLLPTFQRNVDNCHRRIQSHGSDAIFMRPPISPCHTNNGHAVDLRKHFVEHNDPYERRRPPQPPPPSNHLASQQPPMSPSTNFPANTYPHLPHSFYTGAVSRWSPRGDVYRSPRIPTSQYHPTPERTVRYPVSPRHQETHQHYHHPVEYPYRPSNTLSVPSLVSDPITSQSPQLAMAPPRLHFPPSPMQVATYANSVTSDFSPPEPSLRNHNLSHQQKHLPKESGNNRQRSENEGLKDQKSHDTASKVSSTSPLAVVDITNRDISIDHNNEICDERRTFFDKDTEYPSDEDIDPADDFSPLPFDEGYISSFMEFTSNLFPLPISSDDQLEFEI
jgi:hypothetical protein